MNFKRTTVFSAAIVAMIALTGCPPKKKLPIDEKAAAETTEQTDAEKAAADAANANDIRIMQDWTEIPALQVVPFGYDAAGLDDAARAALKTNVEAAEEIVRQLRLRDIGGIIVVDFIDMVLESNRDLVLRRLVECLGRDRTKHQVAEVTSLGLVQMTRKRIGSGLLESFSETCEHCGGRGIRVSLHGDHDHAESPKYRRPANAVDPADVAARSLAAAETETLDEAREEALVEVREELFEAILDDAAPEVVEAVLEEAEALEGAI